MRTIVIWIVMCFVSSLLSQGQSIPINESPTLARTYHLLREDDDGGFLADREEQQDFWDPIKYIPLRSGRNDWFLSMGGEARQIWEQIGNDNWGQQPFMNGCWPQLSFPICSQISRASPPIDRNQPFRPDRRGMYLMGSHKSCRSAESARKLQSSYSRSK